MRHTTRFKVLSHAAIILILASGCGQGRQDAAQADSDSIAEAVPEAETFSTPDLVWKDLKGNVESVATVYTSDEDPANVNSDSIRFNPEGRISAYYSYYTLDGKRILAEGAEFAYNAKGENLPAKATGEADYILRIERDDQGRITAYSRTHPQMTDSDTDYRETYVWDEQGRIHSQEISGWEAQSSTVNHYGPDGELVKSVTTSSEPGYESTATSTYEYTARDSHGNWTERIATDTIEATDEGQKKNHTVRRTERRSIRYRA